MKNKQTKIFNRSLRRKTQRKVLEKMVDVYIAITAYDLKFTKEKILEN